MHYMVGNCPGGELSGHGLFTVTGSILLKQVYQCFSFPEEDLSVHCFLMYHVFNFCHLTSVIWPRSPDSHGWSWPHSCSSWQRCWTWAGQSAPAAASADAASPWCVCRARWPQPPPASVTSREGPRSTPWPWLEPSQLCLAPGSMKDRLVHSIQFNSIQFIYFILR